MGLLEISSLKVNYQKEMKKKRSPAWTEEEELKLRKLYPITLRKDLPKHFPGRTKDAINSRATILGLRKKIGFGAKYKWTPERVKYLEENYPDTSIDVLVNHLGCSEHSCYSKANNMGLLKSEKYQEKYAAERNHRLMIHGQKTRFQKGQESWNKGLENYKDHVSDEGWKRMSTTWFKPGSKPHNDTSDGSIVIRKDSGSEISYLYIRTSPGEWQLLSRYTWEKETGETLDADHVIRFKDGNQFNCELANLEKVTRAENMKINQMSDSGIVKKFMGVKDPVISKMIIENHPELIEMTRTSLLLKRKIKELCEKN